jgi:hypothetical protein
LDIEAFTDLLAEYVDGLGDGQAKKEFIGYPLKSRGYFLLVTFVQKLASQGVFANTEEGRLKRKLLPKMEAWANALIEGDALEKIMKQPANLMFKQGYSGFWKLFVERYNLHVKLNEPVLSVKARSRNGKVTVSLTTKSSKFKFDHVIVATPPSMSKIFMPPKYEGLWQGLSALPIETIAWKADAHKAFLTKEPNVLLYPESCIGNLGGSNGALMNNKAYAICDEYKDGIYVTIGYPSALDAFEEKTKQQLKNLGLSNPVVMKASRRDWPSVALAPSYPSFHGWIKDNQGVGGFTFVGEQISGNNVPAIMEDVASLFVGDTWVKPKVTA